MKRCIVVSIREQQDKETKDELLFITCYALATKMKKGGLYYPKKSDAIINVCINKTKTPMDYDLFKTVLPGALVDITYGINEFTNKTFVAKCDLVPGTNIFSLDDVYK